MVGRSKSCALKKSKILTASRRSSSEPAMCGLAENSRTSCPILFASMASSSLDRMVGSSSRTACSEVTCVYEVRKRAECDLLEVVPLKTYRGGNALCVGGVAEEAN